MSAEHVLLAALFLAVPITAKYVTSFQIRTLMDGLKRRDREIDLMYARLDGLEQEREVIEGAVLQVFEQRRWSTTRRDLMAEELQRTQRRRPRPRRAPAVEERFEPEMPPVWEPETGELSAAAAEAAPFARF
ncbi:MAG TPA: hypothetical protein QGF95_21605 [Candidatus Latescibacteria bacterium]|jgi:hypothetical protein|nr:hypothetical protein [Gemmatimonadaceae bacterium]MDP6016249.1 hypothetical protein [Candidatus Latescibacterota bacterium]HJP33150.1 hypothetical protein [Candidatus Latescibacterota bacterium]